MSSYLNPNDRTEFERARADAQDRHIYGSSVTPPRSPDVQALLPEVKATPPALAHERPSSVSSSSPDARQIPLNSTCPPNTHSESSSASRANSRRAKILDMRLLRDKRAQHKAQHVHTSSSSGSGPQTVTSPGPSDETRLHQDAKSFLNQLQVSEVHRDHDSFSRALTEPKVTEAIQALNTEEQQERERRIQEAKLDAAYLDGLLEDSD